MLAVDGMVEASKVHMQFYLAPELHAAQCTMQYTSKKKVLYFTPLLDTMRCMQLVYAWITRFDRRGVYMLERGEGYIYINMERSR